MSLIGGFVSTMTHDLLNGTADVSPPSVATYQATDRAQIEGLTRQTYSFPNQFTRADFRNSFRTGRYPVTNPQFLFPNWGVSSGENSPPNSIGLEAAFENTVSNTVQRINFPAGDIQPVAPGQDAVSLPLNITLPANYSFIVRSCVTMASNTHWFYDGFASGPDNGVFSNRATSQVMAVGALTKGAGEANLNFYSYGPVNIIGELPPNAISVALIGDSITMGQGDNNGENYQTGFSRRGCLMVEGGFVPSTNYGRSFEFLQALADSRGDIRAAHVREHHTHCIVAIGTNDLGGSYNFNTMRGWYLQAFAKLRQNGVKVAVCTIFPRTTGVNPQVYYNANYAAGGLRDQLNAWFRTQVGVTIDAVLEVAAEVENPADRSYWYKWDAADGTHLYEEAAIMAAKPVKAWLESELAVYEHTSVPNIQVDPSLSGTPTAGGTVTLNFGKYTGIPTGKTVRIYIGGTLVDTITPATGASTLSYVIDEADLPVGNTTISAQVDYTNPAGTVTRNSNTLAVVGFYPTNDPKLIVFLNPDDPGGVSVTGGLIDVYNDLDLDGAHDATSSGSARATLTNNAFGTKKGALFDGSSNQATLGSNIRTLINSGNFVVLVGLRTTNAAKFQRVFSLSNGATMTNRLEISSANVRGNFPGTGNVDIARTQNTNPCVIGYQVTGRTGPSDGVLRVFFNGTVAASANTRTDGTVTHGPFIGRDYNVLNGLQGFLGPLIVLSGDATNAEINKHAKWLANEVGSTWVDMP